MSNRRIVSVAESHAAQRERRVEQLESFKKSAHVAEIENRKIRDISRTPAGQLLKERYEQRFQKTLNEWLAGDPGDAISAVKTHEGLNRIREFLASITPPEKERDENHG